jgi:MYXO-CTERM domain-containing protein
VYEQSGLGDPQKFAPCGDDGTAATVPTGEVTTFQAGETITITIDETVRHPGHFRVAVADDPSLLPEDPPVTPIPMVDACASTEIQDPPVFPILADGVLPHEEQLGEVSFEVTLPDDLSCQNCTLQVIQYMREHSAPCFYHHCATINVEGGNVGTTTGPSDDSGSSTSDGDTGMTSPSTTSPGTTNGNPSTTNASDDSTSAVTADGSGTSAASTAVEDPDSGDEGCGCSQATDNRAGVLFTLLGLFGIAGLRRRRSNLGRPA